MIYLQLKSGMAPFTSNGTNKLTIMTGFLMNSNTSPAREINNSKTMSKSIFNNSYIGHFSTGATKELNSTFTSDSMERQTYLRFGGEQRADISPAPNPRITRTQAQASP